MNKKPKILVTLPETMKDFVTDSLKNYLGEFAETTYNDLGRQYTKDEMTEKLKGKDYVITGWQTPKIDKKMIEKAPDLKLIVHTGGSIGAVVDSEIYDAGVLVASGNYYMAKSVAEGVLCYMLTSLRKVLYFAEDVQEGNWDYDTKDEGLLNKKIGIISLGTISKYLIEILKPFDVKIYVSSTNKNDDLAVKMGFSYATTEEIFKECDIITVHTASKPQTYHIINEKLIKSIKDGALFINTSRGAIVDENALSEELKKKRFTAVLDVFEKEPLPMESPLRGLCNVILMPHRGGCTKDVYSYIVLKLAEDIKNHWKGRNVINLIPKEIAEKMTVLL